LKGIDMKQSDFIINEMVKSIDYKLEQIQFEKF